jgi:cysteinyl-tRNA synthetase
MDERGQARAAKDFKRSDELRNELEALGYEVKDNPGGRGSVLARRRP